MLADPVSRESPFVALASLALAPPHRPAALQAELYSPLLSSHSWIKRFSVLQELGDPDVAANLGGRGGIPRGHTVISEAYGSTGCVNASAWEDRGPEARLATAGDDTKCVHPGLLPLLQRRVSSGKSLCRDADGPRTRRICIWSPGVEGQLRSHGGEALSPVLGYGLTDTIDTGAFRRHLRPPVLALRKTSASSLADFCLRTTEKVTVPTSLTSHGRQALGMSSLASPETIRFVESPNSDLRRRANCALAHSLT